MKLVGCLLMLVACASQPAPTTSASYTTDVITCPRCPEATCPLATCPQVTCPECPKPPPEPAAQDWYCMDVRRKNGDLSGHCSPSLAICEITRKETVDRKIGTPSPCTTQRIAYCLVTTNPIGMLRQTLCARTPENCKSRRQYLRENPRSEYEVPGECRPTLNTDSFKAENTGDPSRGP